MSKLQERKHRALSSSYIVFLTTMAWKKSQGREVNIMCLYKDERKATAES